MPLNSQSTGLHNLRSLGYSQLLVTRMMGAYIMRSKGVNFLYLLVLALSILLFSLVSYTASGLGSFSNSGWEEVSSGSASGGGLADGNRPSIAISSDGVPYVSWDNDQIYMLRWDEISETWVEIGTSSASGGGISNNDSHSSYSSMAISSDGIPYVAWQDGYDEEIYIRRWDPVCATWVEVGVGSATGGGISNTSSDSLEPSLAISPDGTPYITWQDEYQNGIYVKRFDSESSIWEEVGVGSASGYGISNNENTSNTPFIAISPDGIPYIAWSDISDGNYEIYLRRWDSVTSTWIELGLNSATGGGISNNPTDSTNPTIAISLEGTIYVAWEDYEVMEPLGYNEIYVRKWNETTGTWDEVGVDSASRGGISNTSTISTSPTISFTKELTPLIAWREDSNIFARRWDVDVGEWLEAGTGSVLNGGISDTSYRANYPVLATSPDGIPYIAWEDNYGGYPDIYVRRGVQLKGYWEEVGPGSATGDGISMTEDDSRDPSMALGPDGSPYVVWEDDAGAEEDEIYLLYWDKLNNTWIEVGANSASGGGISDDDLYSYDPSVAVSQTGEIFVAWTAYYSTGSEIFVKRWDEMTSSWVEAGTGAATGGGISNNATHSQYPSIAVSSDGIPYVAWTDGGNEVYVRMWDISSNTWVELGQGSATGEGISKGGHAVHGPEITVSSDGVPFVTWEGVHNGGSEIYVQRWDASSNSWVLIGTGPDTGGGVSDNGDYSEYPSIDISVAGVPYVTWRNTTEDDYEIYVKRWNGAAGVWEEVGDGSASEGGISDNEGRSRLPSISVSPAGDVIVAWEDNSDSYYEIYVKRWNEWSGAWEEIGKGSASNDGISRTDTHNESPVIDSAEDGTLYVAWIESTGWDGEVFVRRQSPLVSPSLLDFSTGTSQLPLSIFPIYENDSWEIIEDIEWLTVSKTTGIGQDGVSVNVDRFGMAEGEYAGEIELRIGETEVIVNVMLRVPPAMDTGFNPIPDGFGFDNDGLDDLGETPNISTFRKTFDYDEGLETRIAEGLIFPIIYSGIGFAGQEGHCHGMSSVSALIYLDLLGVDWQSWQGGVPNVYDITYITNTLNQDQGVGVYQGAQLSVAQVNHFLDYSSSDPTVSTVFDEIKQAFSRGEPIILSFIKEIEGSFLDYFNAPMHSVLAYRYEDISESIKHVYIYEVNKHGKDTRYVIIDLDKNEFFYQDEPYAWEDEQPEYSTNNNYRLKALPVSVLVDPDNRRLVNLAHVLAAIDVHADLTITGDYGLTIGMVDGLIVNEFVDAVIIKAFTGSDSTPPVYVLPLGQEYTYTITGKSSGTNNFLTIGPQGGLAISESQASTSSVDEIVVEQDFTHFEFQTNLENKVFSTNILRIVEDTLREFELNDLSLSLDEALIVWTLSSDNQLAIQNVGESRSYSLRLRQSTKTSSNSFVHNDLILGAGDTHYILPANWNDLPNSAVTLSIDIDSNGTIDEEYVLEHELFEMNLPIISNMYNSDQNRVPYPPAEPYPGDDETQQSINTTLSWRGDDPDGDVVVYSIYLDQFHNPPQDLISVDQIETSLILDRLQYEAHYFWQVVSKDEHGATFVGPVWEFTTRGSDLCVNPAGSNGCYSQIQAAIDNASSGTSIVVYEGVYNERVVLKPGIELVGTGNVVINGNGVLNVVVGADNAIIRNFVIQNGVYGIECRETSPRIINNKIINNSSGGIYVRSASPVVRRNVIYDNEGSGIYIDFETASLIHNNFIFGNAHFGIGINQGNPSVINNTIVGNGGAGVWFNGNSPLVQNNIITENGQYGVQDQGQNGTPVIEYNNVWNNNYGSYLWVTPGDGSISLNPKFVNPSLDDYHLQASSPCIDAGLIYNHIHHDIDIEHRPSGSRFDIGADEYLPE